VEPAWNRGSSVAADLLRPSAEEASPDVRTSDALCRAVALEARTPLLVGRWPLSPSCDIERHSAAPGRPGSRRFKTTTSFEPGRLPSDRPGLRSPGRLGRVCSYTRAPDPAPCRLPRSGPAPSRVGWSPQTISRYPEDAFRRAPERNEKDASHRLLQPTYDTSTLRSDRFSGAPPRSLAASWSAPARGGPKPPADDRVELRLTASLQLRRCCDLPAASGAEASEVTWQEHRSVLAGAAIDGPSERRLPAAVFSTARRACNVASDTLCRASSREAETPRRRSARSARAAFSSKTTALTNQGAFHRRVLPPPRLREGSRGARHRSHGFATASRLPALVRLVRALARSPSRGGEARPDTVTVWGQAPLVDFCNQTTREHVLRDRLNPDQRRR